MGLSQPWSQGGFWPASSPVQCAPNCWTGSVMPRCTITAWRDDLKMTSLPVWHELEIGLTLVSVIVYICFTWGVMLLGEREIRKQDERQRSIVALGIFPAWGKIENHFVSVCVCVCVCVCVVASAVKERQCWYETLGGTVWTASYFERRFLSHDVNLNSRFNIFKPVLMLGRKKLLKTWKTEMVSKSDR